MHTYLNGSGFSQQSPNSRSAFTFHILRAIVEQNRKENLFYLLWLDNTNKDPFTQKSDDCASNYDHKSVNSISSCWVICIGSSSAVVCGLPQIPGSPETKLFCNKHWICTLCYYIWRRHPRLSLFGMRFYESTWSITPTFLHPIIIINPVIALDSWVGTVMMMASIQTGKSIFSSLTHQSESTHTCVWVCI